MKKKRVLFGYEFAGWNRVRYVGYKLGEDGYFSQYPYTNEPYLYFPLWQTIKWAAHHARIKKAWGWLKYFFVQV